MIFTLLFSLTVNASQPSGYWVQDPFIASCHKSLDRQVEKGVKFWNSLGYNLKFSPSSDTKEVCKRKSVGSIINVKIDNNINPKRAAQATVYKSGTMITGGHIEIHTDYLNDQTVMNHEIGHILGFDHNKKSGHLMNESHSHQGGDVSGLNKR